MNYNTDRRISPGALTWGAWQAFYVILKYFLQFENYLVEGFLGTLIGNRKYFSENKETEKNKIPTEPVSQKPVCPLQGRRELQSWL